MSIGGNIICEHICERCKKMKTFGNTAERFCWDCKQQFRKPAHIDTTAPVVIRPELQMLEIDSSPKGPEFPFDIPDDDNGYKCEPTPSPIDTTGQELANQFCDEMIQNLRRNVPASIATTQGEPCPECRWSDGFGHAPLCSQSREPTPAPQAEAQESFEEWWKDGEVIQRLPPASESFDKAIARLTWNAQQAKIDALEHQIENFHLTFRACEREAKNKEAKVFALEQQALAKG